MKKLVHTLSAAAAVVIAAVPLALADPSVAHYVAEHPWTATYLPIAAGLVHALSRAWHARAGSTAAGAPPPDRPAT